MALIANGQVLKFHHVPRTRERPRVFFAQLLVDTALNSIDFAREIANAVCSHANHRGFELDLIFKPEDNTFVTRYVRRNAILKFSGYRTQLIDELANYLGVSSRGADTFEASFRFVSDAERTRLTHVTFDPNYVLTFSLLSHRKAGNLADFEFLDQLVGFLFQFIQTEGSNERLPDMDVAMCLAYGELSRKVTIVD